MNKNLLVNFEILITVDPGVIIIKMVKNVMAQSLFNSVSYVRRPGFISFVLNKIYLMILRLEVINWYKYIPKNLIAIHIFTK